MALLADDPVTLALDDDGAVVVPLRFVRGLEAVAQGVRVRLQMFRGEWFLNLDAGVPWWENILGKRFSYEDVSSAIRTAILSTPGVISVAKLSVIFDAQTRLATITWVARTSFGDTPEDSLTQEAS